MSLSGRKWAWSVKELWDLGERRRLLPGEKLILLFLGDMENVREGWAYPSRETIAEETMQTVRSVSTHIKTLELADLITVGKRRSSSGKWYRNVYILAVPDELRDADDAWLEHH
ncbi:hypothetical protein C5C24_01740 [Rathayibacter sp. AY2B3]|uniref:helix-turn-helix domain-containing protein n=1 Tax=Rathayibacter sp. AY2B3 TaxID=2080569 RepID=UPI000CE8F649|nr:helix-turn-helix domain-containing protein [Rathayibacter sp. AY2B3]PPG53750.1 hypothetical protein C5C24_01740 [Rathayibacter sp. AY2B3]